MAKINKKGRDFPVLLVSLILMMRLAKSDQIWYQSIALIKSYRLKLRSAFQLI